MKSSAERPGTTKNWEEMWQLSKDKWFRHPSFQEKIASILKKWFAGMAVLDIGCGTGDYLRKLRGFCRPFGVDISLEALHLAGGSCVLASADRLPFKAHSLGGIFSIGTFHCLEHPEEMLKELKSVLHKDGVLILVVPSSHSLPAFIERHFEGLLRLVCRLLEKDRIPDIHRTYKLETLIELLAENGYETKDHELVHIGATFRSPLIRFPLTAIEKLGLHSMAEEIVIICKPA